jgi:hypothetical protein
MGTAWEQHGNGMVCVNPPSTSWNPQGLSRPVMGLPYLYTQRDGILKTKTFLACLIFYNLINSILPLNRNFTTIREIVNCALIPANSKCVRIIVITTLKMAI